MHACMYTHRDREKRELSIMPQNTHRHALTHARMHTHTETGLTLSPGFNPGNKIVRMPGGLTLVPGLVHWTKPQKLFLVQGRIKWLTNTLPWHCVTVCVRKYITTMFVALFYFEIIRKF